MHGISISKRTLLHVSDMETESEVTRELLYFQPEASHDRCPSGFGPPGPNLLADTDGPPGVHIR